MWGKAKFSIGFSCPKLVDSTHLLLEGIPNPWSNDVSLCPFPDWSSGAFCLGASPIDNYKGNQFPF
jgi:hypothetical protein